MLDGWLAVSCTTALHTASLLFLCVSFDVNRTAFHGKRTSVRLLRYSIHSRYSKTQQQPTTSSHLRQVNKTSIFYNLKKKFVKKVIKMSKVSKMFTFTNNIIKKLGSPAGSPTSPVKDFIISTDEPDNRGGSPPLQICIFKENMNSESERLKTFDTFPCDFMDKAMLAKTGMYYTGMDDKCKCYFCDVEIGRWERHDCPIGEHMRFSQNCPLLRRRHVDNVPLDYDSLNAALPQASYDVCGSNDSLMVPAAVVTPLDVNSSSEDIPPSPASSTSTYYPDHPEYAVISARLRSFGDWPRNMKQKPAELSAAGFFYTGVGDRVKCFSCGGGLKDWDDGDQPWEQHALWLSKCNFLKLIKGEAYIQSVKDKYKKDEESCASTSTEVTTEMTNGTVDLTPAAVVALTSSAPSTSTPSYCLSSSSVKSTKTNDPKSRLSNSTETETETNEEKKVAIEDRLCKICYTEEYNTLFIPCGHVVACANCAMSVTKCPLCRKPFTNIVRAYFS
ncbi:IAP1 family protein [Megaselia abdita]